ncbi:MULTISPECIES: DUF1214 domain-containing protein [unclassified Bradyrhizobium]|uniref:DUF1214 domain-containing protein n=1 Tax=unclassified Bradyrhizobium TaxID=2631580 RepID=UPI001AEDD3F6
MKGLWSLTTYEPELFFAPNKLKRCALGPNNKTLKYNADSGLDHLSPARNTTAQPYTECQQWILHSVRWMRSRLSCSLF